MNDLTETGNPYFNHSQSSLDIVPYKGQTALSDTGTSFVKVSDDISGISMDDLTAMVKGQGESGLNTLLLPSEIMGTSSDIAQDNAKLTSRVNVLEMELKQLRVICQAMAQNLHNLTRRMDTL